MIHCHVHPRGEMMSFSCICLMLLLSAGSISLLAQTFGEITGEVRDASGGTVRGASVTVTNQATGAARSATTNDAGVYAFPALQPGVYDMKVEIAGFRAAARRQIE